MSYCKDFLVVHSFLLSGFNGTFNFLMALNENSITHPSSPSTSQTIICTMEGCPSEDAETLIFLHEWHGLFFSYLDMNPVSNEVSLFLQHKLFRRILTGLKILAFAKPNSLHDALPLSDN